MDGVKVTAIWRVVLGRLYENSEFDRLYSEILERVEVPEDPYLDRTIKRLWETAEVVKEYEEL